MRAILKEDVIVNLLRESSPEGVAIGDLVPGVGINRQRYNGSEVVDLANLTEFWVRKVNKTFELHSVPLPNTTHVLMAYSERKRLFFVDPDIVLFTVQEYNAKLLEQENKEAEASTLNTDAFQFLNNITSKAELQAYIMNTFTSLTQSEQIALFKLHRAVYFILKKIIHRGS